MSIVVLYNITEFLLVPPTSDMQETEGLQLTFEIWDVQKKKFLGLGKMANVSSLEKEVCLPLALAISLEDCMIIYQREYNCSQTHSVSLLVAQSSILSIKFIWTDLSCCVFVVIEIDSSLSCAQF